MFKKIYIEITNDCNLNCPFCIHNKRDKLYLSIEEFKIILSKIKPYTKYIYLHVLGEPLIHPYINELIDIAAKDFYVNITTKGVFIKEIKNNKNIRQINISLHSNKGNTKYLENIFESVEVLRKHSYINYRLWLGKNKELINKLNDKYHTSIRGSGKILDNVFIDIDEEFTWPSLENNLYNESGKCYALKDHIAILVDGSIIPCCLDSNNDINLGNIYKDDIKDIMQSKRVEDMLRGFQNNKKVEELCKHCGFKLEGKNE